MNKKRAILIAIVIVMLAIVGIILWKSVIEQDGGVVIEQLVDNTGEILEVDSGTGTLETLLGELD